MSKQEEIIGKPHTWQEIFDLIDSGKILLINTDPQTLRDHFDGMNEHITTDIYDHALAASHIKEELFHDHSYAVLFEDGVPTVLIYEDEIHSVALFHDVVICAGNSSLTCYHRLTKEVINK